MEGYRRAAGVHLVIAPLIVLGGIGFPVLQNVTAVVWHRVRRAVGGGGLARRGPVRRLTLHTRVVLVTTVCLYAVGVAAIGADQVAERVRSGAPVDAGGVFVDASFMSVTARTAGFNTVPMEELGGAARLTLMGLMLVGGSPGSTAGGVKTAVLAVLVLSVVSTVRGRRETEVFGRTIADALVRRAGTIAVCYAGLVFGTAFLLFLTERHAFDVVLFEAISAATTTGLSLGITGELSPFGKVVITGTMLLGRVGPLTLLASLLSDRRAGRYAYPHEQVALG